MFEARKQRAALRKCLLTDEEFTKAYNGLLNYPKRDRWAGVWMIEHGMYSGYSFLATMLGMHLALSQSTPNKLQLFKALMKRMCGGRDGQAEG